MKKFIILAVCVFFSVKLWATHIVGGEFYLEPRQSGLYDISLILYFDTKFGNQAAKDQNITVSIFRKADNMRMADVPMELVSDLPIPYENPDCAADLVETNKLIYMVRGGFQFTTNYNSPEGYYIVWDRCCRNNSIVNINNPGEASMLFYHHFPRIFNSGILTGYTSPKFRDVQTIYACVNEYFTLDFGADDADGDSLVYSMEDPLIGYTDSQNPVLGIMNPEPYFSVSWKTGFDKDNAIKGAMPLRVDSATGMLEVISSGSGLHVFSVRVDEYRNGIKIGEIRRDFQIYVYNNCQLNMPPKVELQLADGSFYATNDTIIIDSENWLCMNLSITDNVDFRNNEKVSVRVLPVNFTSASPLIQPGSKQFVGGLGDTLSDWKICPPNCENVQEQSGDVLIMDVIVGDDGCPRPKYDTIRLYFVLNIEDNSPPVLTTDISGEDDFTVYLSEGDTLRVNFTGTDEDSTDLMILYAEGIDFNLSDYGMIFTDTSGYLEVNSSFNWIFDCNLLSGLEEIEGLSVRFIVKTENCWVTHPDTLIGNIKINYEIVEKDFEIGNIFTPNGDGYNDKLLITNLPRDVCNDRFEKFEIYNRWGKKVFETNSREIDFDGGTLSDGVYFYLVKYTNSDFKGFFTILR